ncbi:hypothetical protein BDC45DRAFT_348044 [Circinella umbellata]|nr:hypothetical protein BDC45DRAFT_348044 [Circinella umbellata]
MPHSPLENHTPLSNGRGEHQHQGHSTIITSRLPVHTINKTRNKSALNLGSILNPVASTLQSEQTTDDIINQNGNDNNNIKASDHTSVTDRYYKHSPTQHVPIKQEAISHNGVPSQLPTRISQEPTNGISSHFSDATMTTPIIRNTSNNNNNSNNNVGYTSDGDDSNTTNNHTQKQLPHRKRSKEKETPIDCNTTTNNNIDNNFVDNTNTLDTLDSEATLKWQPVETPQGHYQHFSDDQHYINNGIPLTNGYQQQQQQQQRSSTTSIGVEIHSSISTPIHTSATDFTNKTVMSGHHHYHHPSYHHSQSKQDPNTTPLYDTQNQRSNSTSIYTGSVSSPTAHSGNNLYYYHHQYPTPESPSNNMSSSTTPPFFNKDHHYQGDSRKRSSLPLDYNNNTHNQQLKRVRQNSEVVTSVYSMQPPPPPPPSCNIEPQHSRMIQEQSNLYYSFPPSPHQQHPYYYHSQHPHAPSFSPTSIDPDNLTTHYHYQHNQQQYPHPPPPLPSPTPPIKEKKKKKSKVSSEPGKPAKKGRPLKNPLSSSTLAINQQQQQQQKLDAGSSIKPKVSKKKKKVTQEVIIKKIFSI